MNRNKMTIDTSLPPNIPLMFRERALSCADSNAQASKNDKCKYEYYTYGEVYSQVIKVSLALKALGVKRGENIAIISDNRREWLVTDLAVQSLGACDVPRGTDSPSSEIRFIIGYTDCKTAFFENEKQLLKVLEDLSELPLLKKVIMYTPVSESVLTEAKNKGLELYSYEDIEDSGRMLLDSDYENNKNMIENEMFLTKGEDTATIIFTSGTTGTPKGVMLSHTNYISQLSAVHNYMPGKSGEWWMTILPVWHSFERLAQYVAIYLKCGIAYSKPNARVLLSDMAEIKPRWMCGVPRLWDALASGVNKKMEKKGGITFALYSFFMNAGKKYADARDKVTGCVIYYKNNRSISDFVKGLIPFICLWPLHILGNLIVFNRIKKTFGGRFVFPISGGGALQSQTDEFFRAAGLTMVEGYGMTETAPAISFRDYKRPPKNCVGTPFPTIEIRITKEEHGTVTGNAPLPPGEKGMIIVKGPHVMKGYYKRPDLTQKIIDNDGWLNTGDIGVLSLTGELKITGRAKDTIVLLGGENIEPAGIEKAICSSDLIENAVILGQDQKYLTALIVPDRESLIKWAQENTISFESYEKLVSSDTAVRFMSSIVNNLVSVEAGFRSCEKICRISLVDKSFEVGRELSAKQEVMRHKINEQYRDKIKEMYA